MANACCVSQVLAGLRGACVNRTDDLEFGVVQEGSDDFGADGPHAVVDDADLVLLHIGLQIPEGSREFGEPLVGIVAHTSLCWPLSSKYGESARVGSRSMIGGEEVQKQPVEDIRLLEIHRMPCSGDDRHARVWYERLSDGHEWDRHDFIIFTTDEQHGSGQGGECFSCYSGLGCAFERPQTLDLRLRLKPVRPLFVEHPDLLVEERPFLVRGREASPECSLDSILSTPLPD